MNTPKHPHPKHDALVRRSRLFSITVGLLVGLILAGGVVAWQTSRDKMRIAEMEQVATQAPIPAVTIGGPFTLTNVDGKTVTEKDILGKYVLMTFGYTFCPDMCPTGLQSISHALQTVGDDANKVQPVFVSIDPARDTAEKLKEYVASFGSNVLALRGTAEQTAAAAKNYQIYYAKQESEDGPDQYEMDHSAIIYLFSPDGKFITSFPDEVDPAVIVEALHKAWGTPAPVAATSAPVPLAVPVAPVP